MKKIIAISVVLAIYLCSLCACTSVEDLCSEGRYEQAYMSASKKEKDSVLAENVAAYLSGIAAQNLRIPSSFSLERAYFLGFIGQDGDVGMECVIYASGTNAFGGTVSNYWLYTLDKNDEWTLLCTAGSLSDEGSDTYADTVSKNLIKIVLEEENLITLSKSQVNNINNLFENGVLEDVELIELDKIDASRFTKS